MNQHFGTKLIDLTVSKGLFRLFAFWFLALITIISVSDAFAATGSAAVCSDRTPASAVRGSALPSDRAPASLSDEQRKVRLKHAHELLGRYYKKSAAHVGESIPKINSVVYHWTKDHLPAKFKDQSGKIAQSIIDVSLKEGFDPVFLMSVIEGESSWRPEKIGGVGEIGLMQLRPATAKWMASRAGVKWKGDNTLKDPVSNIKLGAAYLSYLRDRFDDHARLYLAAYNMGQSNVDSALDRKIWPKDYPIHVMKRYVAFYEAFGESKEGAALKQSMSKALAKTDKKSVASKMVAASKKPKMQVIVKYTPHAKKGPSMDPTADDDMKFDVDQFVHPSGDVNDAATEQNADADETDAPASA